MYLTTWVRTLESHTENNCSCQQGISRWFSQQTNKLNICRYCRCAVWKQLDANFTKACYFRQIINLPSLKKNQLHQNSLNIFQQIVWRMKYAQSYVLKFLKVLEKKILQTYWNACKNLFKKGSIMRTYTKILLHCVKVDKLYWTHSSAFAKLHIGFIREIFHFYL